MRYLYAVVENLPLAVMVVLGTFMGWMVWPPLAAVYLGYFAISIVLYWRIICPYCFHFGTPSCPSGYGGIAARLFYPQDKARFREIFKKRVAIQYPNWFVPPLFGAYLLWSDFSWRMVLVLAAFLVIAFLVIPFVSRRIVCRKCANRKNCPMGPKL